MTSLRPRRSGTHGATGMTTPQDLFPVIFSGSSEVFTTTTDVLGDKTIPLETFEALCNDAIVRRNGSRQKSQSVFFDIAKEIYLYFVRDHGPEYYQKLSGPIMEIPKRENDLKLRKEIRDFICKQVASVSKRKLMEFLSDIGKQKRKCEKQKAERRMFFQVCRKCDKRCKDRASRLQHEKICRKNPANQSKNRLTRATSCVTHGGRRKPSRIPGRLPPKTPLFLAIEQRKKKLMDRETAMVVQRKFPGVKIALSSGKGKGLYALNTFLAGQLICSMEGELIEGEEDIQARKLMYENLPKEDGSYMVEYSFNNKKFCIDAREKKGFGRYANHSCKNMNCKLAVFEYSENGEKRHIPVLRALKKICKGEEFLWDYSDQNPAAREEMPWLKN